MIRENQELAGLQNEILLLGSSSVFLLLQCSCLWSSLNCASNCLSLGVRRKGVGLHFSHSHKKSYMFWLYICSHHQAGYSTLNKKLKNKIEQKLCGQYLVYISILEKNGDFLSKNCLPLSETEEKSINSFYTSTVIVLISNQSSPHIKSFNKLVDFSWCGLQVLIATNISLTSEHRKAFSNQRLFLDVSKALSLPYAWWKALFSYSGLVLNCLYSDHHALYSFKTFLNNIFNFRCISLKSLSLSLMRCFSFSI